MVPVKPVFSYSSTVSGSCGGGNLGRRRPRRVSGGGDCSVSDGCPRPFVANGSSGDGFGTSVVLGAVSGVIPALGSTVDGGAVSFACSAIGGEPPGSDGGRSLPDGDRVSRTTGDMLGVDGGRSVVPDIVSRGIAGVPGAPTAAAFSPEGPPIAMARAKPNVRVPQFGPVPLHWFSLIKQEDLNSNLTFVPELVGY